MILKDEQVNGGFNLWAFRIECDKCKAVVGVEMPNRSDTQLYIYGLGWRVNSRARKYAHLCKRCANKGRPCGS